MYDIEVIDNASYAVISEGSNTYEFLKAMNSKLVMKKLASAPDDKFRSCLTISEIAPLCKGFQRHDLKRLEQAGLLEIKFNLLWKDQETYTFTEYGLDVMKHLKEFGGDIEIRI